MTDDDTNLLSFMRELLHPTPELIDQLGNGLTMVRTMTETFLGVLQAGPPGEIYLTGAYAYQLQLMEVQDQEGKPIKVGMPTLGTLQWCAFEPVGQLRVNRQHIVWMYEIRDQSEAARKNFIAAYLQFTQRAAAQHPDLASSIQVVQPLDVGRLLDTAKSLGLIPGKGGMKS